MWEIVTLGCTPYASLSPQEIPKRLIHDNYRLDRPVHCKRELYMIMSYCWDADPEARLSFTELRAQLSRLMEGKDDYIELHDFPDRSYYNVIMPTQDERL